MRDVTPLEVDPSGAATRLLPQWLWATGTSAMFSFAIFWTMSIPYYIRYFFLPQPLPSLSGFMWVAGCAGVLGVLCGLPVRLCQHW